MENCQCHTTRRNAEQPELTVYKGEFDILVLSSLNFGFSVEKKLKLCNMAKKHSYLAVM